GRQPTRARPSRRALRTSLSLRSSTALASTPRAVAPTTKAASPSDRTHARMPHDSARSRPAATARVARPFLSTASGLRARVQILCLVFQVPSGLLLSRCSPLFRTSAAPSRGATASAHVEEDVLAALDGEVLSKH